MNAGRPGSRSLREAIGAAGGRARALPLATAPGLALSLSLSLACSDDPRPAADAGDGPAAEVVSDSPAVLEHADRPLDRAVDHADGGGDVPGPSCHHDCFGFVACQNGLVTKGLHAPVPCASWTGSCPVQEVGRCQRGCGAARIEDPFVCPMEICAEHIPKKAGDPCTSDPDCTPTRASAMGDGGVVQVYLRCDPPSGKCVAGEAPVLPDWLKACDPNVLRTQEKGSSGAVADPSCSEGACVFYVPHDQTCIQQGCSRRCVSDDQCPAGAVCQGAPTTCGIGTPQPGYCKPGRLNELGVGLPCR